MSDIIRVDILGQYEKRIATLFSIKKQTHPNINYLNGSLYPSLMNFAYANNLIISLELDNTTISGFVLKFNEHNIQLQVVDENGQIDGETIVLVEDVLSFAVDTITEQNLRLLGQGHSI